MFYAIVSPKRVLEKVLNFLPFLSDITAQFILCANSAVDACARFKQQAGHLDFYYLTKKNSPKAMNVRCGKGGVK
jgi:hypothetical protein